MEIEQEGETERLNKQIVYISDLPEELIEYIFFHLSPYRDLQSAKLVSRQWCRLVRGVIHQLEQNFHDAIACSQVLWTKLLPGDYPSITERYSHCACYYDKSLYIFGGCTSTNTTFNDLWRFNLATRQWIRPLATGTYPSPKACASMVVYKESLVLFGGWSHPTPSPLHQAARFFNELHIYTPHTNRWSYVTSRSMPQLVAGHSACVIKDSMIVFGGSNFPGIGSNDIWIFDFIDRYWYKKETYGRKPSPRYGQSQIAVDDNHILIIGGCGGPNQIFNDVWMLVLGPHSMHWEEIKVLQPEYSAPQLWCHPACKVHDTVVVLSKPVKSMKLIPPSLPKWSQLRGHRSWQQPQFNYSPHSSSTSNRVDRAGASSCDRPSRPAESLKKEDEDKNDMDGAEASWPAHSDSNGYLPQHNIPKLNSLENDQNLFGMNQLSSQEQRSSESSLSSSPVNRASSSNVSTSLNKTTPMDLSSNNASSINSTHTSDMDSAASSSSSSPNGFTIHSTSSGSFSSGASMNRSSPTDGSLPSPNRHDGAAISEGFHNGSVVVNGSASRAGGSASSGLPSTSGSGSLAAGGHSLLNSVPSSRFYHLSMRPNRQKQLEMLQRYEDKIKQKQRQQRSQPPTGFLRTNHKVSQGSNPGQNNRGYACSSPSSGTTSSNPKEPRSLMHLHNLDISKVVTEKTVTWQRVRENISDCIPEEAIFYSLVEGRGELIMFGGIQRDINSMQRGVRIKSHVVSNNLYVLSSPRPNF